MNRGGGGEVEDRGRVMGFACWIRHEGCYPLEVCYWAYIPTVSPYIRMAQVHPHTLTLQSCTTRLAITEPPCS
jgi:hypothetical protein